MRWVLIIAGVVAGSVGLIALAGMMLPQGHVASRRATYRASPEAVWSALTDVSAFPSWRADVKSVELLPERNGHRWWRENVKQGSVTYEEMEAVAPSKLVGRIADENLPYGGTWTWEIAREGDGSVVTITERGEVYNPIFRALARYVFGYTSTMEAYLKSLGTKLGEQVVAQPA